MPAPVPSDPSKKELRSLVWRVIVFFVVAFLLNRYGEWAREIIEKRLGFWVAVAAGVLVIGFIIVFRLF